MADPAKIDQWREGTRRWHAEHPERVREIKRRYRERNADRLRADGRERAARARREHPEKFRARDRAQKVKHRARYAFHQAQRRARLAAAAGTFTLAERTAMLEQAGHRCLACGSDERLSVDHIVPITLGGRHEAANIQPLCVRCNSRKKQRIIDYREQPDAA
jgi:5-methylcytosine-specific restriction protein A